MKHKLVRKFNNSPRLSNFSKDTMVFVTLYICSRTYNKEVVSKIETYEIKTPNVQSKKTTTKQQKNKHARHFALLTWKTKMNWNHADCKLSIHLILV